MRLIDADDITYESIDLSDTVREEIKSGCGILAVRKEDIDAMPTIEERKKGKWIPCSERLPFAEYGESDNVLATCELRDADDTSYRWVKTLYFNGGVWCYPTGETYEQKVIAWMPLPEPYKGRRTDETQV